MQIEIVQELMDRYPTYCMGVVSLSITNPDYTRLKEKLTVAPQEFPITKHDIETTWCQIFADMGASERRLPSVVSLWKLIETHGGLQPITYFVDAYNYISVTYGIPMGGYDSTKLPHKGLTLRFAHKGDTFQPLGLKQIERIKDSKEIAYYSGEHVICRYWNNKDLEMTKIDDATQQVIITFDHIGNKEIVLQAMDELYALIHETSTVISRHTTLLDCTTLQAYIPDE